jgi:hypothetical protein
LHPNKNRSEHGPSEHISLVLGDNLCGSLNAGTGFIPASMRFHDDTTGEKKITIEEIPRIARRTAASRRMFSRSPPAFN